MTDSLHDVDGSLQAALGEVLTEQGPMAEEQLAALLSTRLPGLVDGADSLLRALEANGSGVGQLIDGRWGWLPTVLAGRVLTHRVTAAEITHDVLSIHPDLSALTRLVEFAGYDALTDGTPVAVVANEFDPEVLDERDIPADLVYPSGLLLPAGHLSSRDIAAGDLVGLRLAPGGLELWKLTEPAADGSAPASAPASASASASARLARGLGDLIVAAEGGPVELDAAIWTVCADEPDVFTETLPPLTDLLPACGSTWEDEWLAGAGFDFTRWREDRRLSLLAERYQLSGAEAAAVLATVDLYDQVAELYAATATALASGENSALPALLRDRYLDGPEDPGLDLTAPDAALQAGRGVSGRGGSGTVRDTLAWLAVPQVADAVLSEILGAEGLAPDEDSMDDDAGVMASFTETCEPMAPREARVALRWLRAKAYEQLGDVTGAERTYLEAQTLDPDWSLNLLDLARYASDRGDAVRALSLMERAGAPPDDPLMQVLRRFQPIPRPELGRNQPCWCGSGRKYKVCHAGRETYPLADRALWLYQKAAGFLDDESWWEAVVEVATERARYASDQEGLSQAIHDPLVADLVLFEGGAFAEFVALRGALLPDDERSLAGQWLLVERSVYEVTATRPGDGLALRDVRTGDVHEVRERTASSRLPTGSLVCARVVPAGDTTQIFGGLEPVAADERSQLTALLDRKPDPVELAEFLSRRYAPTGLSNTEGDPLVL